MHSSVPDRLTRTDEHPKNTLTQLVVIGSVLAIAYRSECRTRGARGKSHTVKFRSLPTHRVQRPSSEYPTPPLAPVQHSFLVVAGVVLSVQLTPVKH